MAEGSENPGMRRGPVGIFDSGLGGLTVLGAVRREYPEVDLIYLGDTARIPYGPKSAETVTRFAVEISAYLVEQGASSIVVACNTASSYALAELTARLPVPVTGVIIPGARAAVEASSTGRIGVIGTKGTIGSRAYQNAILSVSPLAKVFSAPCPLLVPLVEEGRTEGKITEMVLEEYLEPLVAEEIDCLVLGCTHYPLLKPSIERVVGGNIKVIDSATTLARSLDPVPARGKGSGRTSFLVTDDPTSFRAEGEKFLGAPIGPVRVVTIEELIEARARFDPPDGRG